MGNVIRKLESAFATMVILLREELRRSASRHAQKCAMTNKKVALQHNGYHAVTKVCAILAYASVSTGILMVLKAHANSNAIATVVRNFVIL